MRDRITKLNLFDDRFSVVVVVVFSSLLLAFRIDVLTVLRSMVDNVVIEILLQKKDREKPQCIQMKWIKTSIVQWWFVWQTEQQSASYERKNELPTYCNTHIRMNDKRIHVRNIRACRCKCACSCQKRCNALDVTTISNCPLNNSEEKRKIYHQHAS